MVGGTRFRRRVIHGEISRVLVPQPLWQTKRCSRTAQENCVLDNAFALIEGHPACAPLMHCTDFSRVFHLTQPSGSGFGCDVPLRSAQHLKTNHKFAHSCGAQ